MVIIVFLLTTKLALCSCGTLQFYQVSSSSGLVIDFAN